MAVRGNVSAQQIQGYPADSTKFLRGDNSWAVPPGTTGSGLFSGLIVAPPTASWSWDNQQSAVITSSGNVEYLYNPGENPGSELHVRYRTAPGTPYTLTACLLKWWTANDARCGLVFRESSSGKLIVLFIGLGNLGGPYWAISKYTNVTTFSADYFVQTGTGNQSEYFKYSPYAWLRIKDDGTNLSWWYSMDGLNFIQIDSNRTRGDFFSTAPDQIGFTTGSSSTNRATGVSLVSWATA